MKKFFLAIAAIIMVAGTITFVACNKEGNEIVKENNITENSQTKELPELYTSQPVQPHFTFRRTISYPLCNSLSGFICGFDLTILSGDEACWMIMFLDNPYAFLIPSDYLFSNNAGELVDSARNGYMTFHADCELLSDELVELAGTDVFPAGRYRADLTTYKGDSVVCIYLNELL